MRLLAVSVLLLASLAACGGGDGSDGQITGKDVADASAKAGKCSDIWVAGKTLPKGYENCTSKSGLELQAIYECRDGSELIPFGEKFYARAGQEIKPYTTDAFNADLLACKPT